MEQLPVDIDAILAKKAELLRRKIAAPTGDRIKITQSKKIKLPNGTETPGPLELIIVDFVSLNQYYAGNFNRNEVVPPDCFALGEEPELLAPSASSKDKQADTCAACPQNQWGSARQGNGKACKNSRLLAVLPPDFSPGDPLWLLQVSPTALKAFDTYVGAIMANFNSPPIKVVTTIAFDPKSDYPSLRFGNPQPNPRLAECVGRMEEARARLLIEPEYKDAEPAPTGVAPGVTQAGPVGPSRSAARVIR